MILSLLFPLSHSGQTVFSGTYQGNLDGTPATCSLTQSDLQLSGKIDASGYIYQLSGTAHNTQADGKLLDPQTQGQIPYKATLAGDILTITLIIEDNWGGVQELPLQFRKGTAATAPIAGPIGGQSIPQDGFERDPELIGVWGQSSARTSGTFTMARTQMMEVRADGTFAIGGNKIAGGGQYSSFTGGNTGEPISQGKWRTQGGYIYVDEGYGWERYCGYYVDANNLMLKFENGERDVWDRYE